MTITDLVIYRGDTHILKIDLLQNGQPVDLNEMRFIFEAKTSTGDILKPILSVDDGKLFAIFTSEMTANAGWNKAVYDLRAVSSVGVNTLMRGKITVLPSVSHVQIEQRGLQVKQNAISINMNNQAVDYSSLVNISTEKTAIVSIAEIVGLVSKDVREAIKGEIEKMLSERTASVQQGNIGAGNTESSAGGQEGASSNPAQTGGDGSETPKPISSSAPDASATTTRLPQVESGSQPVTQPVEQPPVSTPTAPQQDLSDEALAEVFKILGV